MLAIRLPEELEARLNNLAKETHRSKTFYVLESLQKGFSIDELEDVYLAEKRIEDIRGKSKTETLDKVLEDYGLSGKSS